MDKKILLVLFIKCWQKTKTKLHKTNYYDVFTMVYFFDDIFKTRSHFVYFFGIYTTQILL